jgi:hypothetical protein
MANNKKSEATTVLEIITAIGQIVANAKDGSVDKEGKPIKIGLKREEPVPIKDKRVVDGFACSINGNILKLTYQTPILLKDTHEKDFESDMEEMIEKIVKYIKKEYKGMTGKTLNLKKIKGVNINVQTTSAVRVWAEACCKYEITGVKEMDEDELYQGRNADIKKFINSFKDAKEPENVKIKEKDNYKHFEPTKIEVGQRNK